MAIEYTNNQKTSGIQTFDNGDIVTPFFVGMKGAAEAADIVHIRLEVGLQ